MSVKKTIARSFTVSTIEDGVSVQAQYAPNANPTSSQIHNVWQNGDLYMRTRETDSTTWSAWHRIVGENGGETDYSFAISQYRTTENAQTSPSDIGVNDWQDAPLVVTTAKPYLWSQVQQKSWNESTQQYVVDSTRYIRLTGEEGVVYDIQTPVDSIHIGENQTSATISGTAKFYKKEGTKDKVQTVFYYGVYKRTGTTFTKVATGNANSYAFSNLSVANTVNAVVIYLFASSYTGTDPESQTYLCKREMLVVDAGNSPYFADLDNEMDSIACANDGKPSSEQTVETNVKLYRGSTALSPTLAVNDDSPSGAAYTSGTAKDGITVTWNNTTGNIKFKFGTSNSRTKTETFCITLTVTDNGATITRYLYFTVNCIRAALDGNPAALYRLVPSVNEIVKKKDGTYVPSGNTYITCGVTKNVGGTQSTPAASEYVLKYSLNGGAETTYTATSVKANQVTSNLVFILYVNSIVVDRETIGIINDGVDGTSPYFADLDNEMDSIACNADGSVASAQTVSTVASMFHGSSVEPFTADTIKRNGTSLSWDGNNSGVWPRWNNSTKTLSLEFDTNASIADIDVFELTVKSTNDNTITRKLHFTINGVRANAIYRLVPSVSSIIKKKDGTYNPSGNVTCSVVKIESGAESTPDSSEYTLKKSVNGGSEVAYSATAANTITSDLKFILYVGGVIVDKETIPLVSDGNDGIDYEIVFDNAFAKVNENGVVTAALSGYAYKYVGSSRVALQGVTIRYGYKINDSDTYATTTTSNSGYFDAGDWFNGDDISTYGKNSPSIFAAIIIGGSVVHAEFVTISEKGETGSRGKTGRFYYYAQEWSDDSSISYSVTDAEAPYFFYNNNYWVFNPTANGSYTMHQMGTPSSSSANWKLMVTDFKFIITEAIFGAYAHFGSFIINGDWLISTKGKVYGDNVNGDSNVSGTIVGGGSFTVKAYTLFDSYYPSDDRLEAKVENDTKTISSSEMSKEIMQVSLSSNYVYRLSLSSSHSGSVYIRVRNDSYGSSQLIYLYGTSGTYTATFRVPTTETYIVEIYKSSGTGTATVWNTVVSRLLFSPNYCVDGNSGKSYQSSGVFSGFVKKKKITITTSNMNDYVDVTPFGNELLFERCGTCIELASGVDVNLSLPILSKYIASRYSEQQKDEIRSYIGTKIIIYNKSGSTLNITLNITSTATYATALGTGKCACYECSLASETVDGTTYENIKWTELSGGGSIL